MQIRAGYRIAFQCEIDTPMMAMLSIHPSRNMDLLTPHRLVACPDVPIYDYIDNFGNVVSRLTIPAGGASIACDFTIGDDGSEDARPPDCPQHPVSSLPDDVLLFLLGSRYCETDRLLQVAWSQFGHIEGGRARVEAIVDFVHHHLEFGYHHARPDRTAWNAYQEKVGVCRDFAHLAVALCRCMNIPARYCTGYLGDIGVPPVDAPMDFSAWFDVYLDGAWYHYDARHNCPRIGRILMARGRDAIDTALTTGFGRLDLVTFEVVTEEVEAAIA